jgi:OTU domain-containing protein 6
MINNMEQLTESIDCEIHDVVPDGNCLFRSVVDQLRMNGEFHWTASTLRRLAVEFLRANPNHEDGSHLAMFLSTETWDEYLSRMAHDKEWGDQLILRLVFIREHACFSVGFNLFSVENLL